MKATTTRALMGAAFGLALAIGSLVVGTNEAHARVIKPRMCSPYEVTCPPTARLHEDLNSKVGGQMLAEM